MEDACSILPQDCWELIFNFVDDLEALSLVCKDFLSISSRLVHYLPVCSCSIKILNRLLRRFRCLKTIDLSDFHHGDPNLAVLEIARSGLLNVETLILSPDQVKFSMESFTELGCYMKSLKALDCSMIGYFEDSDLAVIASSLPWLEELNISCSFMCENLTDDGIEMLSKSLTNLRKIDISGNQDLSVSSLLSLSSNCPSLRKIKARGCDFRIQDCFGHLFRHCPNLLVSISVSDDIDHTVHPSPAMLVRNPISFAKNIYDIRFYRQSISDDILCAIAISNLPLKKFKLSHCRIFPRKGFAKLLRAYQSQLKELDLNHTYNDEKEFSGLVQYLQNLTRINLYGCKRFTIKTLFSLIKNCPSLVNIDMSDSRLGLGGDEEYLGLDLDLVKNHHIRNLRLLNNWELNDELLVKIGLCCPNLQLLNVRSCNSITADGIGEIFKACDKMKDLFVSMYKGTKLFRTDLGLSELMLELLEVLGIDDEGMAVIAKRCPRLRKLDLKYSEEVTNKGVMVVVENCRKLREINLSMCSKVTDDILPLMVSSRPSLRKIAPPCADFVPNEDQADLFWLNADGYLICNTQEEKLMREYVAIFLHLGHLSKISVEVLREMGSNMKNLKSLTLTFCPLSDRDLIEIASSLSMLQQLDISYP